MSCKYCGECCCEKTIQLNDADIARIELISPLVFFRVRNTGAKVMNWIKYKNRYICIFFDPFEKKCKIYNDRPKVCREYYCTLTNI